MHCSPWSTVVVAAVIELCPNPCIMHRKQSFPDTKVWLDQNVHNSVSCTVVSMKHVQRTIVSPFVGDISLAERKQKHAKYRSRAIFRVLCFPDVYSYWSRELHDLCAELVLQRFASPKGNCTESYAISTRNDVSTAHQCNLSGMCTDSPHAI